jgi:Fucose permease
MFIASTVVLNTLQVEAFRNAERAAHPEYDEMLPSVVDGHLTQALSDFAVNQPFAYEAMQAADLITIRGPYVTIAVVVGILFFVFLFAKLPRTMTHDHPLTMQELKETSASLIRNARYREGVVAQAFYVGAQIMVWTFVIHYGMTVIGLTAAESQGYNIVAMMIFLSSRFICTFILGYIMPGPLLILLAAGGILMTLGTIFLPGYAGFYSLLGISACMSLMFPTIYAIALKDMGDEASLASAGLVMAIVGGALMPPIQGALIDAGPIIGDLPSIRTSFLLPLVCFFVVATYGLPFQSLSV